ITCPRLSGHSASVAGCVGSSYVVCAATSCISHLRGDGDALMVGCPERLDLDLDARVNPVDAGDLPHLPADLMIVVVHDPAHRVVDQLEQVVGVAALPVGEVEAEPDLDRPDQDRLSAGLCCDQSPGGL